MAKTFTKFVCQQCGAESPQWFGRCPNCQKWNTLVEMKEKVEKRRDRKVKERRERIEPVSLSQIKSLELRRVSAQIEELDRVLGNGIVPGSVTLLAGDPGIGKSTLLLQTASRIANKAKGSVLYVSGEESPQQIKIRAKRLGVKEKNLLFLNETNVDGSGKRIFSKATRFSQG